MTYRFFHSFWILCWIPGLIFAKDSDPLEKGNFALLISQQPGPLVSFGENIVDKGTAQLFVMGDAFIGHNNYLTDITPGFLYGIRDDLSIFLNVPFSPGNKDGTAHSSGFEDVFAQLEYAYFTQEDEDIVQQGTLVASIAFPTGSISKQPPTGFGSTSFFIGTTYSYMKPDWFFFTSPGAVLMTSRHGTKAGNEFFYQGGLGRNIPSPDGWIFAWMIELDGTYTWKNRIKGTTDSNSGGNVIYITPSFWASSKNLILQLGVGYPVLQHLNGHQSKQFLLVAFDFGYTF